MAMVAARAGSLRLTATAVMIAALPACSASRVTVRPLATAVHPLPSNGFETWPTTYQMPPPATSASAIAAAAHRRQRRRCGLGGDALTVWSAVSMQRLVE